MAIEFLKESDPKKVEAWDRIHDKRKLYRCERCGAEWKCEYHENKFGSQHEYNGDPDILCQCCGFPTVKEIVLRGMERDQKLSDVFPNPFSPGVIDDKNCTTCVRCNLLYDPPVCRINGESLPNPTCRFCNKYEKKNINTYPGVADDITEEAYDRRDGKR